jgi:lipid II:glycine glycyltransferase (peptidoglycan interpeptide bridge formation enzyme)
LKEAYRLARNRARILRLVVEIECRHDEARIRLASALATLGFQRIPCDRIPDRTLIIDLAPSEEAILADFGRSTRQNIRRSGQA